MYKTLSIMSACALVVAVSPANAGMHEDKHDGGKNMGKHMGKMHAGKMFKHMDSNDDGKVSREEFMDKHRAMFDKMDADDDGQLSKDEMKQKHKKKMKKGHSDAMDGGDKK